MTASRAGTSMKAQSVIQRRLNQASGFELHQRPGQNVEAHAEVFGDDRAVHRVVDEVWIATFESIVPRDGDQKCRKPARAACRGPPLHVSGAGTRIPARSRHQADAQHVHRRDIPRRALLNTVGSITHNIDQTPARNTYDRYAREADPFHFFFVIRKICADEYRRSAVRATLTRWHISPHAANI